MIEFSRTGDGRKFFDADLPRLLSALEAIATELSRLNASLDHATRLAARAPKGGGDDSGV